MLEQAPPQRGIARGSRSAKRQFVLVVQQFAEWIGRPQSAFWGSRVALGRLSTDDRMEPVWRLFADRPDAVFDFIQETLTALELSHLPRYFRETVEIERGHVAKIRAATQALQKAWAAAMSDTLLLAYANRTTAPDIQPCLAEIEAFLSDAETGLDKLHAGLSRKHSTASRIRFSCEIGDRIERRFGAPHYEEVAALTRTVFDVEDVSAETVRSATRRGRKSLRDGD